MENSLQSAYELLEQKKYEKSIEIAMNCIKSGEDSADAHKIIAISALNLLPSASKEEDNKVIYDMVTNACNRVTSLNELIQLKYDFDLAFNNWERFTIQKRLKEFKANPTMEHRDYYLPHFPDYSIMHFNIHFIFGNPSYINKFSQNNTQNSKIWKTVENEVTKDEVSLWEIEVADSIYADVRNLVAGNGTRPTELIKDANLREIELFFCADSLYTDAIRYEPHKHNSVERCIKKDEFNFTCYKKLADEWTYALNVLVYLNGQSWSLLDDETGRAGIIRDINGYYRAMKEINLEFVAPELPKAEPVTKPHNNNNGGCYVATAVYGSYDCPQVWTLRRFRDDTLAKSWYGRAFIHTYYAISPTLVKWFGETNWFKNIWKPTLDRMVWKLNSDGVADTPYEDKVW